MGAHPDDIELGCGGALLAHRARGDEITLLVMTTGEEGPQDARSRIREQEDAAGLLGATLLWGGFPDGAVPNDRSAVNAVQDAMDASGADVVYAPRARRHPPGPPGHGGRRAGRRPPGPAGAAVRVADLARLHARPSTSTSTPTSRPSWTCCARTCPRCSRTAWSTWRRSEAQARYHGFRARIRHAEAFETERFLWELGRHRRAAPAAVAALADRRPTGWSSVPGDRRRAAPWALLALPGAALCLVAAFGVGAAMGVATIGLQLFFLVFFLRHLAFVTAAVRHQPAAERGRALDPAGTPRR